MRGPTPFSVAFEARVHDASTAKHMECPERFQTIVTGY